MLKIRDLGLNALPNGYDMAAKKGGTKCAQKTCVASTHCPVTGSGTGGKRPAKKSAIGHDEIERLQHQLLHKMVEDVTR